MKSRFHFLWLACLCSGASICCVCVWHIFKILTLHGKDEAVVPTKHERTRRYATRWRLVRRGGGLCFYQRCSLPGRDCRIIRLFQCTAVVPFFFHRTRSSSFKAYRTFTACEIEKTREKGMHAPPLRLHCTQHKIKKTCRGVAFCNREPNDLNKVSGICTNSAFFGRGSNLTKCSLPGTECRIIRFFLCAACCCAIIFFIRHTRRLS